MQAENPDRVIEGEVMVEAPVGEVWDAWTTEQGVISFFAPAGNVELWVNGRYEILFNPDAEPGQRGAEGTRVLALQVNKMLAFTWNAPPHLEEVREQLTHVVIRLEEAAAGKTRVRLTHSGWGDGGEWDQAFDYFVRAWKDVVLPRLEYRFSVGAIDWTHPPSLNRPKEQPPGHSTEAAGHAADLRDGTVAAWVGKSILEHNRQAWNEQVEKGNRWTVAVSSAAVDAARKGRWEILLTPSKPVPSAWFPELRGLDVLCLASGGGQQGPILAAAGATVTVFDNSPRQLDQDRKVAEREGLSIRTVEGDMAELGIFDQASFDLVVHPVSNSFVPDVRPVWREAYRVLRPGGALLSGFANPALYLLDYDLADRTGVLQIKYVLPYSDLTSPSAAERQRNLEEGAALEFGHTLQDQIGGQIEVGFVVTGFYEDADPDDEWDVLGKYMSTYIAIRALKPRGPRGKSGRPGRGKSGRPGRGVA